MIISVGNIAVDLGENEFLTPYIHRQLRFDADAEPEAPTTVVRIVTDDDEGIPAELGAWGDLPVCVIRCPQIVGTGMRGLVHRIAAGIYKGTYVHIAGNEARISVVHAVDVARAVALAAGTQGTYTLTDTVDPTIHDLADAFAYRMDDKRIITIKPKWARWWYGRTYFDTLTTDHLAVPTFCDAFPELKPVSVVEYLRTHVYDDESL